MMYQEAMPEQFLQNFGGPQQNSDYNAVTKM